MTDPLPPWPAYKEFNWHTKVVARTDAIAADADATATRVDGHDVSIADAAAKLRIVDEGGNLVTPVGSTNVWTSPDGSRWTIGVDNSGDFVSVKVDASNPLPGTDPIPGADPENIPDTVTIGANTHDLDGINIERLQTLVMYTASSPTTTNQFGVEVVVRKSDGHVVRVNDRIAVSNTAGTTFDPTTEYVLSGWGTGASYPGDWLRAHATVGVTVVLSSDATPDPTPPVGSNPSTKQVVVWHHAFSGPRPYTGYPSGVKAAIDRIVLVPAQSASSGTGLLGYPGTASAGNGTNLLNDVTTAKAAGVDVLMGIGGSSDGGITCLNNTQAQQMVDSIVGFVGSYGINGIAFDLEDISRWNVTSLKYVVDALKTKYGNGFLVDVTAGYYEDLGAGHPGVTQYNALARALGSRMDTFSLMEYDYPQASQPSLYGTLVRDKVAQVVAAGVPVTKIIFGQAVTDPANPGYAGYTTSVANALSAYNTVKASYPTLGGAFIWEDKISAARSSAWDWVLGMAATIHA